MADWDMLHRLPEPRLSLPLPGTTAPGLERVYARLQYQVAYTLFRLPAAAAQWGTSEELLPEVVLPYALERAPGNELVGSLAAIDLAVHVLDPLVGFGLLERRGGGGHRRLGEERYRCTPLAARFFEFDI